MDDQRLARLRATAHPLRLRMLSLLTGQAMSAADLARELDVTHANASYHLRQLADAGRVQLVEEVSVRGGRAKRYRYLAEQDRSPDADQSAPSSEVTPIIDALVTELRRRLTDMEDLEDSQFSDAELWLDPKDWAEVVERVSDAMIDLHAAARPADSPGTIRTTTSVFMAKLADPTPAPDVEAGPDAGEQRR